VRLAKHKWGIGLLAAATACAAGLSVSTAGPSDSDAKGVRHPLSPQTIAYLRNSTSVAMGAARGALHVRLAPLLRLTSGPCCLSGEHHHAVLGRSVNDRPIRVDAWASVAGDGSAPRVRVLVFGCVHGTECAGRQIVRFLPGTCPPFTGLWAVPNLNPDGFAAGTRLNGRGVDLNRNFPAGWRPIGERYDLEYSGPHPFSEPETRLAARLIRLVRPRITIWFHQEEKPLVRAWGPSVPAARRFASLAHLPFYRLHWLAGTAPNWQNHRFPHTASFVVELPPGPLSHADAARYAIAVFDLTRFAVHWRDR
jgi:murein peptide amidase A